MSGTPSGSGNVLLDVATGVALDIVAWWRQRHADGEAPPTDAEAVARVKAKIAAGTAEGDAALAEHPEVP